MFPRTYHEGTILTIYMSLCHRAKLPSYCIVNLAEYLDDTWIEGIHILSLSSHLLFKLVTSTGTYGWLLCTVFQSISSRLPYPQNGAPVARLSDVMLN